MESVWSNTIKIKERPALTSDLSVEVAVIGGGMAGILTAFLLTEQGIETVVLEADRIGSGATKNTTAKITAAHDLIYDRLITEKGLLRAKQYAAANSQAIDEFRRIIHEKSIDCDFVECFAHLYTNQDVNTLEREAEAALRSGIDAVFTTETELPFEVRGAVRYGGQAMFHPLKFLDAVSKDLTVYEHTKVKKVDYDLITTENARVRAKHIVFASHFPFINVPGYYFARMHQGRSYVLALENAANFAGTYEGIDADGFSFRNYGEMTLFCGGDHRTGENFEGGKYRLLRKKAAELWPKSQERFYWSAQDCMTPDSVPYIGRFSRSRPDWYVCTGFGKWGMTSSIVSATIISRKIVGEKYPFATVFSPQRDITPPAAKAIAKNGLKAVKGLGRSAFDLPEDNIKSLPEGNGGIVEYDGEKYGVFKDRDGQSFIVEVRCPHMGCQLEWNPDELSWDCPCHGSRFDIFGKLIDNPSQEDIKGGIRAPDKKK